MMRIFHDMPNGRRYELLSYGQIRWRWVSFALLSTFLYGAAVNNELTGVADAFDNLVGSVLDKGPEGVFNLELGDFLKLIAFGLFAAYDARLLKSALEMKKRVHKWWPEMY